MPDTGPFTIQEVIAVKRRHEDELMSRPNVVGVGVGLVGGTDDAQAGTPGIVVTVRRVQPEGALPAELEGVPVQIREIGTLRGQADER
jgi:hypothetical protein